MGRFLLFLFLVVAVPIGVYWAGNERSLGGLSGELSALRGTRPEVTPQPEPDKPDPEKADPEAKPPAKEPDESDESEDAKPEEDAEEKTGEETDGDV